MPKISKFDGGIITGVNDMYLKNEHATVLTNVDIERIGLLSYKEPHRIGKAQPFFYEFPVSHEVEEGGEKVLKLLDPPQYFVTSSNNQRSYAEFDGRLCYSDGGPQCKYTEGEMSPNRSMNPEFKWLDMGVDAPDGEVIARPVTVEEDIGPDKVALISNGEGYISVEDIKYRVVGPTPAIVPPATEAEPPIVYIHDIDENPGRSIVEWKLDPGYKVYREIIDEYGDHTDQFALVGEGTFIDGGSESHDKYNFITIDNILDYSSYRQCYVDDVIYSVPFALTKTATTATVHINAIYALNENDGTWQREEFDVSVTSEGNSGIASGFVWHDKLYVMINVGAKFYVYDRDGNEVYTSHAIGFECFKGTTVEHDNKVYFFDPSNGLVARLSEEAGGPTYIEKVAVNVKWGSGGIWNRPHYNKWIAWYNGQKKEGSGTAPMSVTFGSAVLKRSSAVMACYNEDPCLPNCGRSDGYYTYGEVTKRSPGTHIEMSVIKIAPFTYAKAEDSVYTLHGDKIYALINDRAASNVRVYDLPNLDVHNTDMERVTMHKIVGLGGSSGCNFTYGDFQVFPIMGGVITYSRVTNQTAFWENPKAVSFLGPKGFTFSNYYIRLVAGSQLIQWKFSDITVDYDLFDERTLTGSYVYNVGQQTQGGLDGPVMLVESEPISINKGHMHVDLTGVIHTNALRVYRTGGHLTMFKMVKDEAPLPIDGFIDKIDDVTLALAREGEYQQAYAPPAGLKYLVAHRGMLFGAVRNRLYWSQPGFHEKWDEVTNMKIMDRLIYGIVSSVNGLIIFMEGRIALLAGSAPIEFDMRTVTADVGCIDELGIRAIGTGAMFFSKKGLCITDGVTVKDISYNLLGSIEFTTLASATTDRNYYALVNNWTESDEPFVVMIFDITREASFTTISAARVKGLGVIDGKIAHTNKGELYDTFGGDGDREYHYKSGNINMESPTIIKEWDRIRVTGEFIGVLTVYLDDIVALKEDIDTINERVNLHLPKHNNKSKNIKFELLGKGDVISIEYSLTDRKTTK